MRWVCFALTMLMMEGTFAQTTDVVTEAHVIGLSIKVGGDVVMTPVVELLPDREALLSLDDDTGAPLHTLKLLVRDVQTKNSGTMAVQLDASLYQGSETSGQLLVNPSLVFERGGTPSVTIDGPRSSVEIEVTSHAIRDAPAISAGNIADCTTPSVLPSQDQEAARSCCSRACSGGINTLKCCGTTSCCACGVCCYPP